MDSFWKILRFIVIPLLSLIATFFLPPNNPFLWGFWVGAFIAVCESGTSTAAIARPAFWVGIHALVILFAYIQ